MKVFWSRAAARDRDDIFTFIGEESPQAAVTMDELFSAAVGRLALHPLLGHTGLVPGTRELIPHASYRLVYEVREDAVWILALMHTARRWPPLPER